MIQNGINADVIGYLIGVAALLLLFGLGYNALIDHWHKRGYSDGYVWLEVAGGVAFVLVVGAFVVGWQDALAIFVMFALAGGPMALGDIRRHVRPRREEVREP